MSTRLYRHGRVRTPDHPAATAFVVSDGRLAWLGEETGADTHADAVDEVVNLDGGLVLPGFVDAHVHVSQTGAHLRGVDLTTATSLADALARVEAGARASRGRPVLAAGWDEERWPERRPPTAAEFDRASAGGVVYAPRIDGHSAVISSALAAVVRARELPGWLGDGLVTREADNAAGEAFDGAITPAQRDADIETALRDAAAHGIVAVHECGGPLLTNAEDFAAVLAAGRRADLPLTVGYWAQQVSTPEEASALVALHGALGLAGDLNIDGSIGSRTAHLRAPYTDRPGHTGNAYRTVAEVRDHVAACALAGVQSGFHVIGDGGMDTVIAGYEDAARIVGVDLLRASRPRLEHVEMIDAEGVRRLAALGITASVQPAFDAFWGGPDGMYATRLGPDRVPGMNPLLSFTRAGVPLALGSDTPVTPWAPWEAIAASVEHHDTAERVTADVALDAHTRGGWHAAGEVDGGILTVGAPATLAVWRVGEWSDEPAETGLPQVRSGAEPPSLDMSLRDGVRLH